MPSKENYLHTKIHPFDPTKVNSIEQALEAFQGCSFQGRNLGIALEIWTKMCKEGSKCLKVLTFSGAMTPAGMAETVCCAIEHGMVDVIVATGANITHDIINSLLGQSHYLGSSTVDDNELYLHKINRIYDTYLPEEGFAEARKKETRLLLEIYGTTRVVVSPSEVFAAIGARLPGRSFLKVATQHHIPIFCGATSDSDFGLNLGEQRLKGGVNLVLDEIADVIKFSEIIKAKNSHGTIIVGGGVPRNWGQQVFPFFSAMGVALPHFGYTYSVRIHTATEYDGGLSGCTLEEGKTWGKYTNNASHVSVWCDATIAFPLLVTAMVQRIKAGKI
ncbi:MAG: Deoxyhypusine synthase [Promethearchaeota archaeon CR_4]|nr:MAG: Deoxyhypusine synthase [Candidatus Lokiarchaeota archaeon CR_4]